MAVGAKRGFGKVDIETGKLEYINTLFPGDKDKQDLMRVSDGAVDVEGRFWAGSMRRYYYIISYRSNPFFICSSRSICIIPAKRYDVTVLAWDPHRTKAHSSAATLPLISTT